MTTTTLAPATLLPARFQMLQARPGRALHAGHPRHPDRVLCYRRTTPVVWAREPVALLLPQGTTPAKARYTCRIGGWPPACPSCLRILRDREALTDLLEART